MTQYLLSVHSADGECRSSMTEEEMQGFMENVMKLEAEMKTRGVWQFSARLTAPSDATVVRMAEGEVLTTDGPFVESKEHLGGFYLIEAKDLDEALVWASKVTDCVQKPIEVRPLWSETEA